MAIKIEASRRLNMDSVNTQGTDDLEQDIKDCQMIIATTQDRARLAILKTRLHLMQLRLKDWQ